MPKDRKRSRAELEELSLAAIRRALGSEAVVAVQVKPLANAKRPGWRLARTTPPLPPTHWLLAFDAVMPLTLRFDMAPEPGDGALDSASPLPNLRSQAGDSHMAPTSP